MDVACPDPCQGEAKSTAQAEGRPGQAVPEGQTLPGDKVSSALPGTSAPNWWGWVGGTHRSAHTSPPGWVTPRSCPTDRDPQALPMALWLSGASSGLWVAHDGKEQHQCSAQLWGETQRVGLSFSQEMHPPQQAADPHWVPAGRNLKPWGVEENIFLLLWSVSVGLFIWS